MPLCTPLALASHLFGLCKSQDRNLNAIMGDIWHGTGLSHCWAFPAIKAGLPGSGASLHPTGMASHLFRFGQSLHKPLGLTRIPTGRGSTPRLAYQAIKQGLPGSGASLHPTGTNLAPFFTIWEHFATGGRAPIPCLAVFACKYSQTSFVILERAVPNIYTFLFSHIFIKMHILLLLVIAKNGKKQKTKNKTKTKKMPHTYRLFLSHLWPYICSPIYFIPHDKPCDRKAYKK